MVFKIKKGFHFKMLNECADGIYFPKIGNTFTKEDIVRETEKAVLVNLFFKRGTDRFGGGADFWIPKSCIEGWIQ